MNRNVFLLMLGLVGFFTGTSFAQQNMPTGTAKGDLLYWNGSNWIIIPPGSNGQVLTIFGDVPQWQWLTTSALPSIGANFGGGVVAYILQPGDPGYNPSVPHGLIAAPYDQSKSIEWGYSATVSSINTSIALGTGQANTDTIVNNCGKRSAAYICDTLTLGGYSDWYLPSKNELNMLFINQAAIGGFTIGVNYWSSSWQGEIFAWTQIFGSNGHSNQFKCGDANYLRAVRSF